MEFLSTTGITSTEAEHLCNIAAEEIKSERSELNNLTFLHENIEVLTDGTSAGAFKSKEGYSNINNISLILQNEAAITVLIAYLKEAIKFKQALLEDLTSTTLGFWIQERGYVMAPKPTIKNIINYEEEALKNLPTEERVKYLLLESKAAVLGKAIHKSGLISNAIDELNTYKKMEIKETEGKHLIRISRNAATATETIHKMFDDLQRQYRECNSELNRIKSTIKTEATKLELIDSAEYQKQYNQYQADYDTYQSKFKEWMLTKSAEIAKLKIVIPEQLISIYKSISKPVKI